MRSMDFERLAALSPANKAAATVTGRGTGWTPAKKLIREWDAWQENPLPIGRIPSNKSAHDFAGEFIGAKRGRLLIVGYGAPKSSGAAWVVRCDCGMYGHQKAKFLKKTDTSKHMCPNCNYLEDLKSGRMPHEK